MTYIYKNPAGMTDSEKTEHIKIVVTAEGVALRKRHPILNHQNAIGAMILYIYFGRHDSDCRALYKSSTFSLVCNSDYCFFRIAHP